MRRLCVQVIVTVRFGFITAHFPFDYLKAPGAPLGSSRALPQFSVNVCTMMVLLYHLKEYFLSPSHFLSILFQANS